MQTETKDLIFTKEAADILGESIKQVTRRVAAGELTPVTKLPGLRGAYVFDASDVTTLKNTLSETAPARRASKEDPHAGASSVSGAVAS